jgi:hypothetical protein
VVFQRGQRAEIDCGESPLDRLLVVQQVLDRRSAPSGFGEQQPSRQCRNDRCI